MDTLEERLGSIESVLEGFLDEIRGVISAAFTLPCFATVFNRHPKVCRHEPSAR